jgi:hypothetical protein
MPLRPPYPDRFLDAVCGSAVFAEFCRRREVAYAPPAPARRIDARRWQQALSALEPEARAEAELDLAAAAEMATDEGNEHLVEAAAGVDLPPDGVPAGAELALWFVTHRPEFFSEVFLHHQVAHAEGWRQAYAKSGIAPSALPGRGEALAEALRSSFAAREGVSPFCAVRASLAESAACFVAHVSARPRSVELFSDSGRAGARPLRLARPLLFVYNPADGTVLLRCPQRSRERIASLFALFGDHVLGCELLPQGDLFDLDRLKAPLPLLPDGRDLRRARVKSLHLRYPERDACRTLKLETVAGDEPGAVYDMLRLHGGGRTDDLRVCHAEIEAVLLWRGREKGRLIRLWRDRCDLPDTPLGRRLRDCLHRWNLCLDHARRV